MRPKQQSLIRWDRKDKRLRVKQLADSQGMKINRFVNWLADMALAQHEAEARFGAAASKEFVSYCTLSVRSKTAPALAATAGAV